jgi:hypothetical protein
MTVTPGIDGIGLRIWGPGGTPLPPGGGTFLPVLTAARVVYIDPAAGNDSNNGTSAGSAWLTLARMRTDLYQWSELRAPYTVHLVGTGTLVGIDFSIPFKGDGGAFDMVCDTYTRLAGPFTATAGSNTSVTVASGLGVNTWRARTLRPLTGAAATAGIKVSIAETTDTVATFASATIATAMAVGDTFDITAPAVAISGTCNWLDQSCSLTRLISQLGVVVPINTLVNLSFTGVARLLGGDWVFNGIQVADASAIRFSYGGASVYNGTASVVNARVGQISTSQWRTWGLMQPDGTGSSNVVSCFGYGALRAVVVVGFWQNGTIVNTGTVPWASSDTFTSQQLSGNIYGASAATTAVLIVAAEVIVPTGTTLLVGGAGSAPTLIDVWSSGKLTVQGTMTPRVTASITAGIRTRGNAAVNVLGTMTAAALTNAASSGTDARKGGAVRWNAAPTITGVLGDNIVSTTTGYFPNAFFAAAGDGISNPAMAANICRQG